MEKKISTTINIVPNKAILVPNDEKFKSNIALKFFEFIKRFSYSGSLVLNDLSFNCSTYSLLISIPKTLYPAFSINKARPKPKRPIPNIVILLIILNFNFLLIKYII